MTNEEKTSPDGGVLASGDDVDRRPRLGKGCGRRGRVCEARCGALLPRHGDALAEPHRIKAFTRAISADAARNSPSRNVMALPPPGMPA